VIVVGQSGAGKTTLMRRWPAKKDRPAAR
jgi:GTPase SAR1 family protein